MYILKPENETEDLDLISIQIDNDYDIPHKYCSLSVNNEIDFYFPDLLLIESFSGPAIVLDIGGFKIPVPCLESPNDYKIAIGEGHLSDLELISIEDLNGRDFSAFVYNPLSSFRPEFKTIEIVDTYKDLKWFMPRLSTNHILCVPLRAGPKPPCIYLAPSISCKRIDLIPINNIID